MNISPLAILTALLLLAVGCLTLTYVAVHIIKPQRFRLRAKVTRWCELDLELERHDEVGCACEIGTTLQNRPKSGLSRSPRAP